MTTEIPHHLPGGGYEGLEGLAFSAAKMTAYHLQGKQVTVTWSTFSVEPEPVTWWKPWTWRGRSLKINPVDHTDTGILSVEDHTEMMWTEGTTGRNEWIALFLDDDWVAYLEPDTEILEVG